MMLNTILEKVEKLNLAAVIDHSGRGGNMFFLTIFDEHPEVLCCPLIHYTYSYILSNFGDSYDIEITKARKFLVEVSYFKLVYDEGKQAATLRYRMGLDPEKSFDRKKIQDLFDEFCDTRKTINRREMVLIPFLIYAYAMGRDLSKIKYVLLSDAISLRSEHVMNGFSGKVIDHMLRDFPNGKLVHIVRDPRATFASPRHQFVNSLGNMYGLKTKNFVSRFYTLVKRDFQDSNGCVYLYWLLYLFQTYRTISIKKKQYSVSFATVKNEDLNLNFSETIRNITDWLGVNYIKSWDENPFVPTIMGSPWKGTGAYNSRYQKCLYGPLENDPDEVVEKVTGPNRYVTQRWRDRLNRREIELIEHLFQKEFVEYKYDRTRNNRRSDISCLIRTTLLPFEGEIPTLSWIKKGLKISKSDFIERISYCILFVPFYIISRLVLFDLVIRRKFFNRVF